MNLFKSHGAEIDITAKSGVDALVFYDSDECESEKGDKVSTMDLTTM